MGKLLVIKGADFSANKVGSSDIDIPSGDNITGYTMLEYIESSGTQYINTGYVPNPNTSINIRSQITDFSKTAWIFGAGDPNYGLLMLLDVNQWSWRVNNVLSNRAIDGTTRGNIQNFVVTNGKLEFSGLSIELNKDANPTSKLFLFTISISNNPNSGGYSCQKLYSCTIKEGSNTIMELVPVLEKKTGKYGLYDTVGKKFYGDANGGNFTGA